MKLTKTTILGLTGLIAVLFAANTAFLNVYVTDAIISLVTLGVYNFWPSDDTGSKPLINVITVVSFVAAIAGYFLDHPRDVVDAAGAHTLVYVAPIAVLASIKNSLVAIVRFIESNTDK